MNSIRRQIEHNPRKSAGFAGFLILLMLLLIGGAVLFTGLGSNSSVERKLALGETADTRLAAARDALIGTALGNIADASGRPAQLPAPDNLEDGNYDGNANNMSCLDGTASPHGLPVLTVHSANYRCLGKLPWKTLGLSIEGVDEFDVSGHVPWYSVSANLSANNSCLEYLNPGTVATTPTSFACPSSNAPPFPWLKVCDQTGKIVSDRVAFVVIMPGEAINTNGRTQARTGTPRPQPSDYLDAIPVPAGWSALDPGNRCTAYDNAGLTNEFVIASGIDGFNDRVAYVTIDDLMARANERVAQTVREALIAFSTTHGRFPSLVQVGVPTSVSDSFIAGNGLTDGFVPFHSLENSYRFKTELNWSIPSPSDTVTPGTSSSPSFLCFGGGYQCRIRTSPGTATIPRTVTTAEFAALKNAAVTSPAVSCKFVSTANVECDAYSYTQTTAVTYNVQYRLVGTFTYFYYGTYSGTQTRTVTVGPLSVGGTAGSPAADANGTLRRSVTTGSVSTFGALTAVDRWSPNALGTAPFDLTASFPLQTGRAQSNGNAVQTYSNIRLYPLLPQWYVKEKWYEYVYAAIAPDVAPAVGGVSCSTSCLTAGSRGNVNMVVISAGAPFAGQNRYSGSPAVADFLEAQNATGSMTRSFAETGRKYSNAYADSVVTIPR